MVGVMFNNVHVTHLLSSKDRYVYSPSSNILTCSVIESRDDVASSNTRMGDPFKIARAIATLCFSPPDSFNPRSPT
jgi:hypothetical protein